MRDVSRPSHQPRRRRVSLRLDEDAFQALQALAAANACTMQALLEAGFMTLVDRAAMWGLDMSDWPALAERDQIDSHDAWLRIRARAWEIDRERRARE